jgi:Tfp pilus assembly protein PilF
MGRRERQDPVTRARRLLGLGLEKQLAGDLDAACALYRRSLAASESAEGWCYLGWCHSFRGNFVRAIAHCRRAIAHDDSFGNAYNDLGAYLVELGRSDEAIHWFERAKEASRYDTPQFPYLNLARVHIARERYDLALIELHAARLVAPVDERIDELVAYVGDRIGRRAA